MHLINNTPFQALTVPTVCQQDKNHLIVVIKASFDIEANSQVLKISDEQQEIFLADEYWGEADKSSLRYETDIALIKPQTDMVVIGSVYPANGSARVVDAGVSIGPLQKVIRVFGNRNWEKGLTGYQISSPEVFECMPLYYENAYGGSYANPHNELPISDERNPVGKGYVEKKSKYIPKEVALPNLENPSHLITDIQDQPVPWSTGFVARSWLPRRNYAGSYDVEWKKKRNPLLPVDFDERAHNAASAGLLAAQYMQGGEPVKLVNLSQDGLLVFNLPNFKFTIESYMRNQRCQHQAVLDTIVIEPDEKRVCLTWRSSFQIHWNLAMIEWIKVTSPKGKYN
jgi:hypothetical protein